jgi:hypothetical protein
MPIIEQQVAIVVKEKNPEKSNRGLYMTIFEVRRVGNLMKATQDPDEAQKEFEALAERHPQSCICLTKVDVLLSTPAQQAFNQKREQTL